MFIEQNRVMYAPDNGAGGGGVTPPGDGSPGAGDQGGDQQPGWIAALPDEQKGNEYVKGFQKPGDFVDAALKLKTEHEALKPKLDNAIFKPGENATDEEKMAFNKALGVPDSAEGYEFPKGEGVEHDERMINWAKDTFKSADLSVKQGAIVSQAWDGFMQGMEQAKQEADEQAVKDADTTLKTEWKSDYDKNIAETQRGYQAFEKVVPGFTEFLAQSTDGGARVGDHPMMLKAFHAIGKAIGDDFSFPGGNPRKETGESKGFASIYKTPNPPKE